MEAPAARSHDHHYPSYLHSMALRVLLLPLLFLSFCAAAQTPSPCAVVMPEIVSPSSEVPAQATCPCRITACEVKVFNRWAKEVWSGTKLEGFPNNLLSEQDFVSGTYLWQVKYTAIQTGMPVQLEKTGYMNVIK